MGLLCDLEAILQGRITWRCMHVQLISLLIGVLENFATKCRVRVFSKKQSPSVMYLKLERANMYKKQNVRLVPEADTLNLIEVSIWRFSNSARSCQLIINLPFEISPTTAAQQSKCPLP